MNTARIVPVHGEEEGKSTSPVAADPNKGKKEDGHDVGRPDTERCGDNVWGKKGDGTGKRRTDTAKKNTGLVATVHRHTEDK